MSKLPERFGCQVFNDKVMQERLPKETYKALKKTIEDGAHLDITVANVVAHAMKEWAVEQGATHYTHWFQPMTGITAEKHDSFISPVKGGAVILTFSGKELIKGEPDASSFPSGGLRATFEARGYTAWDPTSYAFVKDKTLYIPTAFCSYTGDVLDKKTPLLRSMEAISKQAVRILRLFDNTQVQNVVPTVGPEQEYFLIDQSVYDRRPDLQFTGRTLLGNPPPKGQELEDHYFGAIKPRVAAYMADLDEELWKLGVLAKTEHNEAAPAQHELAPIFSTNNIATDHNQLTMEMMKQVASRHGMVCLLHEKPFAGVNGSGKHNNWSLTTDTGVNLLDPGTTPYENAQFLLFLCAVIKAVDDYQDLLRLSVASAGNDQRLGGYEAPPAIVSMFLGSDLMGVLEALEAKSPYDGGVEATMELGADVLPTFPKDTTDRNRTSPFAFTGNKFEFRMLGSSFSIAGPNIIINTIVAEELDQLATRLEKAGDFTKELNHVIRKVIREHKRIIFNGNGYDESWVREAEKRGLLNLRCAPDALPHMTDPKNIALFVKHKVFSEAEVRSRTEIMLENYCKVIRIEGLTLRDMLRRDVLPAVMEFSRGLAQSAGLKKALAGDIDRSYEETLLRKVSSLASALYEKSEALASALDREQPADMEQAAHYCHDEILRLMDEARVVADQLEAMVGSKYWPYPTYGEMLFSIKE